MVKAQPRLSLARQFWVVLHRWAGLTLALFLTVAGLTGSVLAFYDELDRVFAPNLYRVEQRAGVAPLDPLVVRELVLARFPGGVIDYAPLSRHDGEPLIFYVARRDAATGAETAWSEDWDELFVDPYTGEILGHRLWGEIGQGSVNLVPFVYKLHYTLLLGDIGVLMFGIAALVWTFDCFVGFYLTLPVRARRDGTSSRTWPSRWAPAWVIRWRAGAHKLSFDLHRAGGLWLWPLLLVFAWSAVSFNLPQVYDPVMRVIGYANIEDGLEPLAAPRLAPRLDFAAARDRGRSLAHGEMARRGGALEGEYALYYRADVGAPISIISHRDSTSRATAADRSLPLMAMTARCARRRCRQVRTARTRSRAGLSRCTWAMCLAFPTGSSSS